MPSGRLNHPRRICADNVIFAERLAEPDTLIAPAPRLKAIDFDSEIERWGRTVSILMPAAKDVNLEAGDPSGLPEIEKVNSRNACDKGAGLVTIVVEVTPTNTAFTLTRSPPGVAVEAGPMRILPGLIPFTWDGTGESQVRSPADVEARAFIVD